MFNLKSFLGRDVFEPVRDVVEMGTAAGENKDGWIFNGWKLCWHRCRDALVRLLCSSPRLGERVLHFWLVWHCLVLRLDFHSETISSRWSRNVRPREKLHNYEFRKSKEHFTQIQRCTMEKYLHIDCSLGDHCRSFLWKLGVLHIAYSASVVYERFNLKTIIDVLIKLINVFYCFRYS